MTSKFLPGRFRKVLESRSLRGEQITAARLGVPFTGTPFVAGRSYRKRDNASIGKLDCCTSHYAFVTRTAASFLRDVATPLLLSSAAPPRLLLLDTEIRIRTVRHPPGKQISRYRARAPVILATAND